MTVIEKEKVPHADDGLEAIIFTAQGDMRQVCAGPGAGLLGLQDCAGTRQPEWGPLTQHC